MGGGFTFTFIFTFSFICNFIFIFVFGELRNIEGLSRGVQEDHDDDRDKIRIRRWIRIRVVTWIAGGFGGVKKQRISKDLDFGVYMIRQW